MPRQYTEPLTPAELEAMKTAFCSMPTYNANGEYILTSDFPALTAAVGYDRSPEQIEVYKAAHDKHDGGRMTLKYFVDCITAFHDTAQMSKYVAELIDKDKNGYISRDEFAELLNWLKVHDSRLSCLETTFEEFIKAADANEDGKVSIEECAQWVATTLSSM